MRIPSRHGRFMVALTAVTLLLLFKTVDVPKAYESCTGNHSFQSPGNQVDVTAQLQGVDREEWPLWLFVDWGDGTSYYMERNQWGAVSFGVQHIYTSPGDYAFSWSVGNAFETCAGGGGGISVP